MSALENRQITQRILAIRRLQAKEKLEESRMNRTLCRLLRAQKAQQAKQDKLLKMQLLRLKVSQRV